MYSCLMSLSVTAVNTTISFIHFLNTESKIGLIFFLRRRVWEHHVEEGFSSGPAGFSCGISLPRQPGAARADSAVHHAAKLPVLISEPAQPRTGHLSGLGESHHSADAAVEQSGGGVSRRDSDVRDGSVSCVSPKSVA